MVLAAQMRPNRWWKASSLITSWTRRRSTGSLVCAFSVAKAPIARPSTSICMPTIFL